jgi:hypothetical protein
MDAKNRKEIVSLYKSTKPARITIMEKVGISKSYSKVYGK